ncbi:MAG: matrixin family metalloprotease, partial [Phycisphaerae bacterium]
ELYPSFEGPAPAEPYSTVHFGSYDPNLLGVAENVDEYNLRAEQRAIVFVDTFSAFGVLDPSPEEIAQALANVTSHEIGHLLGLYHTQDAKGVMDITASLRQMMGDQFFGQSPLHPEVFAVGNQDAVPTLLANVGGDAALAKSAAQLAASMRSAWYDQGQGRSARSHLTFGTCRECQRHRIDQSDTYASSAP